MKPEVSAWINWVMRPIVNLADVARETTRDLVSFRSELVQLREESQRLRRERPHLCGFHIFATRGVEIKKGRTFRRASGGEVKAPDQNWIWGDQRFLAPDEIHCFTHYPLVSLKEGFIVTWGGLRNYRGLRGTGTASSALGGPFVVPPVRRFTPGRKHRGEDQGASRSGELKGKLGWQNGASK